MSEEEFFNRLLNKIDKEFGYDTASTLELMFMTKEKKIEQLENIRKEAVDYMKENCDIITIDRGWIIRSELTTTGLGKLFKILNKGDSK